MKWINTNGGPYIVLPWEHRAAWEGTDTTDYTEACDRTGPPDWFGAVKRPAFTALAIPRGSLTWVPRADGGVLVHCDTAPSSAHRAKVVRTTLGPTTREEPARLRRTRTLLKTTSGKLVACDGSYPGRAQPRAMTLALELRAGTYAVAVADYEPDDETAMRLFRLTRKPR